MFESLDIMSHKGKYTLDFCDGLSSFLNSFDQRAHYIVDANVLRLYPNLQEVLQKCSSVLSLNALESSKSLERFSGYVEHFMQQKIRRGERIIAIGGGIIQDIASFISSTILRGVEWEFFPTTLLAQADSCIGSKSSVNVGIYKNIVGTFYPPKRIVIAKEFLRTLAKLDFLSGVGEIIKIHALAGLNEFKDLESNYAKIINFEDELSRAIVRSLQFKKKYVEDDEFDRNSRLVLNYGHTFGHALETSSHFSIPHGIAVTIGMDMANFVSQEMKICDGMYFDTMHELLIKNSSGVSLQNINFDLFLNSLMKDKKHGTQGVKLVLPTKEKEIKVLQINDLKEFNQICQNYFTKVYCV